MGVADNGTAERESHVRVEPEPVAVDRREDGRGYLRTETLLVLALSLGASAVSALISFIGSLTKPGASRTRPPRSTARTRPVAPGWTSRGSCSGSRPRWCPSCSSPTC